jgi:hypothetical protein
MLQAVDDSYRQGSFWSTIAWRPRLHHHLSTERGVAVAVAVYGRVRVVSESFRRLASAC